jgi:hypothetical protein
MVVLLGSLIVIVPIIVMGLVALWREHRYKEQSR